MEELLNLLFYFKRLKVNMAFCILLAPAGIQESNKVNELECQLICAEAGVIYRGIQTYFDIQYIFFNEPKYKSTLMCPVAKFTFSTVAAMAQAKREQFGDKPNGSTKIFVKIFGDIEMEYKSFLYLKNIWARRRFNTAQRVLKLLNEADRIENYRFVERSQ